MSQNVDQKIELAEKLQYLYSIFSFGGEISQVIIDEMSIDEIISKIELIQKIVDSNPELYQTLNKT